MKCSKCDNKARKPYDLCDDCMQNEIQNNINKNKLIGTAYVNIIKDEKGQVKFAYGYELNEKEISLNELSMFNSFLGKLKDKAQQDFNERLEINDKEFSIEKDGVEEDE